MRRGPLINVPERRTKARVELRPPSPSLDWAYFFDIDGTLAEIELRPDGVRIERDISGLIERLNLATGGAVALITGRSLADADQLMQHPRLPIAGQHGLERRNRAGRIFRHEFDEEAFLSACEGIRAATARTKGLVVELKGLSLALHYREAPHLEDFCREIVTAAAKKLGREYVTLAGKMVVELKPAGKDKGVAIREFMQEPPFRGRIPVFAGDDITDEHGFDAINAMQGHSIKVGGGPTNARWRLRTVPAVRDWLSEAFRSAEE